MSAQYNGLAAWRQRLAEERQRKMDDLAEHRKSATVEVRDGKEFRVVRLPDRYDFSAKPKEPPVQLHGPKRKQFAA